MKKRSIWKDKRAGTITLETLIFIILNAVFIFLLLFFVYGSSRGAFIYERIYAKQIALLIDNAKPDMTIGLDMEKAVEIAKKNKKPIDKIVSLNQEENRVEVSLSNKGGHSFKYFSDYDVELKQSESLLSIKIREKNIEENQKIINLGEGGSEK